MAWNCFFLSQRALEKLLQLFEVALLEADVDQRQSFRFSRSDVEHFAKGFVGFDDDKISIENRQWRGD